MQKLLCITVLVPFLIAGTFMTAKAQEGNFTIDGSATPISSQGMPARNYVFQPAPGWVYLHRYTLQTGQHKDSVLATGGHFSFSGKIGTRELAQIIYFDGHEDQSIIVYLEPGAIHVSSSSDGEHAVVTGTTSNDDRHAFQTVINGYLDSLIKLNAGKSRLTRFSPEVQDRKFSLVRDFIARFPQSSIGIDLLDECARSMTRNIPKADFTDQLESAFRQLSPAVRSSPAGQEMANRIDGMRAGGIGTEVPLFTQPDTSGHNVSLVSFRGKYVLLDFWASWCEPCLEEMPNVANAYHHYKGKDFVVIGVSLDRPDTKAAWLKDIRDGHMDWIQVSDLHWWNNKEALALNINAVPANFLIDPNGKIIAKNLRGEALQQKLEEIFK